MCVCVCVCVCVPRILGWEHVHRVCVCQLGGSISMCHLSCAYAVYARDCVCVCVGGGGGLRRKQEREVYIQMAFGFGPLIWHET